MDISCLFVFPKDHLPTSFSVTLNRHPCASPNILLLVTNPIYKLQRGLIRNFTVVLWGPAHKFNQPLKFIEWIETSLLLGAEKFIIYNVSISCPLMLRVVRYYQSRGILDVFNWNLPPCMDNKHAVHENLQMAMLGDCQYRTMYDTRYIVGIDIDEMIVPRTSNSTTWLDIIANSDCETAAFYEMCHLYFDSSNGSLTDTECEAVTSGHHCDCPEAECSNSTYMLFACKTHRLDTVYAIGDRSKYIARPSLVDRLAVHTAYTRESRCEVHPNIGALHHYRAKWLRHLRKFKTNLIYDDSLKTIVMNSISKMLKVFELCKTQKHQNVRHSCLVDYIEQ